MNGVAYSRTNSKGANERSAIQTRINPSEYITYDIFPQALASERGKHTRSSLQTGTSSTE